MPNIKRGSSGKPLLVLPPNFDLTAAAALKADLQCTLAQGEGLEVDASQVQRVTSPSLQILAAGARAFAQAGGPAMRISSASEAFSQTVSSLALTSALGIEGKQ